MAVTKCNRQSVPGDDCYVVTGHSEYDGIYTRSELDGTAIRTCTVLDGYTFGFDSAGRQFLLVVDRFYRLTWTVDAADHQRTDPDSDRHTGPDKQLAEHAIQLDYLHRLTELFESQLKYVNSDLDWLMDAVKRIERDTKRIDERVDGINVSLDVLDRAVARK